MLQTLPQNLQDNSNYPLIEFVILDYNSSDGLAEWITSEMAGFIKNGKVKFAREPTATSINRSHARNICMHLASGDIICNVDADNLTGRGFASYVNSQLGDHTNRFLSVDYRGKRFRDKSVYGRLAVWKQHFMNVGGYDETMTSYGYEDIDLVSRLSMIGLKNDFIEEQFLNAVDHPESMRTENDPIANTIHRYYVSKISPAQSQIICLFNDGRAEMGTVIPGKDTCTFDNLQIAEGGWLKGCWEDSRRGVTLRGEEWIKSLLRTENPAVLLDPTIVPVLIYELVEPQIYRQIERIHSTATNYTKMCVNRDGGITNPNGGIFGKGNIDVAT